MRRRPPRSTRTDTLFPYTTLFRSIALTGKQFHTDAPAALAKPIDPRTLAMNQGSRVLLEQLGAWPAHSASIETVHVSQRGRLGRTLIRSEIGRASCRERVCQYV